MINVTILTKGLINKLNVFGDNSGKKYANKNDNISLSVDLTELMLSGIGDIFFSIKVSNHQHKIISVKNNSNNKMHPIQHLFENWITA
jgi:hypothetical protein